MERAREELLDRATELAAIIGGAPEPNYELGAELAAALGNLYRANDEWQEAQLALEYPR